MAVTVLLDGLKELVLENLDEHPIVTCICVFLGSVLLLALIYEVYTSILQAIYRFA